MKVLKKGELNCAVVCNAECTWCGSTLKFFLKKGDKRVTYYGDGIGKCVRFICPVCGERNTNVSGYLRDTTEITFNYRKITVKEYEDEIKPLNDEVVDLSEEDKDWLEETGYNH